MSTSTASTVDRAGKFLTIALGEAEYAIRVGRIREIVGYVEVAGLPGAPAHVRGTIHLRGEVTPVIDLRVRLGMASVPATEETCIIVIESLSGGAKRPCGLIVDRVSEVVDLTEEQLELALQSPAAGNSPVMGEVRVGDSILRLLNVDRMLEGLELLSPKASAA